MTKVLIFSLSILSLVPSWAAQRAVLKLSGYVAPKAQILVQSFSVRDGTVELTLKKNTARLNFRMVLEPDQPGRSPLSIRVHRSAQQFVLSHRGESRKVDLRRLQAASRDIRMTILSP